MIRREDREHRKEGRGVMKGVIMGRGGEHGKELLLTGCEIMFPLWRNVRRGCLHQRETDAPETQACDTLRTRKHRFSKRVFTHLEGEAAFAHLGPISTCFQVDTIAGTNSLGIASVDCRREMSCNRIADTTRRGACFCQRQA